MPRALPIASAQETGATQMEGPRKTDIVIHWFGDSLYREGKEGVAVMTLNVVTASLFAPLEPSFWKILEDYLQDICTWTHFSPGPAPPNVLTSNEFGVPHP